MKIYRYILYFIIVITVLNQDTENEYGSQSESNSNNENDENQEGTSKNIDIQKDNNEIPILKSSNFRTVNYSGISSDWPMTLSKKVITFPIFLEKWRGKAMSKSEIQEVYRIADADADGFIDSTEWLGFFNLFLEDFKKCDSANIWEISESAVSSCFEGQAWIQALAVKGKKDPVLKGFGNKDGYYEMFAQVDRDGSGAMNFAEYLFLRKTASAWRQCASSSEMN
jgi:hypothetical protein